MFATVAPEHLLGFIPDPIAVAHDMELRPHLVQAAANLDDPHQLPAIDDRDAVGQPLQLIEVVRRDHDRAVVAAECRHELAEVLRPERVEALFGSHLSGALF